MAWAATAAAEPGRGKISGQVTVSAGDASGVVVYLVGFSEPAPAGPAPEMVQKDRHFEPPLIAITAGQEVSFPNADPIFHNVFSVSPASRFDLGQYYRGETKTRRFDEVGPVEVYCNIHPEMAATILVLPNRRFAVTAADGTYVIDGIPAGTWTAYAYHRLASTPAKQTVVITPGGTARADFSLVKDRQGFRHKNKYGEDYHAPGSYPR
jgi:plastocyanin